jgi:hypothetical protein
MKYCSLGSFCQSAEILIKLGVREFSTPFDWIYSNIDIVKHCLQDDFKTYLDKSEYFKVEPNQYVINPWGHKTYSALIDYKYETVPNGFFVHHDPLNNEKEYAHFGRCVQRFRDVLASDEKKVFLYMYKNRELENAEKDLMEGLLFTQFLDGYTSNYRLIFVYHSIGEPFHSIIKGHNLDFIKISASKSLGDNFENHSHNDYLNEVIKKLIDDIR